MNNPIQLLFTLTLLCIATLLFGQYVASESPYFHITSESAEESFPLLSTKAVVGISGPIANVKITQVYQNNGTIPIEATYVFPSSTRAAVHHMQMTIGDRVIVAEIKEKKEARKVYEEAKESGKHASLLEQHRPNVFQMNVANILPGEAIVVEMRYTEFMIPEDQQYTFVYPSVVGPRYTGHPNPEQGQAFANQPHTKKYIGAMYDYDIDVKLDMSIPVIDVKSISHKTHIDYWPNNITSVDLDTRDETRGTKDFVLKYSLAGEKIATGIQTFKMGDENFFLCQMEAPSMDWNPEISPREYIFIIDVSGSMRGYPLDVSKELMKNLLGGMRSIDKFNVMFFAGSAFALSDQSIVANRQNVKMAFDEMEKHQGGGGTQLLPAMKRAMSYPKLDGYSRSFVVVTDGYVTVEDEAFQLIHESLDEANFFAFGIGTSVNRHLIEGMAHVGRGEPFIVLEKKYARLEALRLQKYITNPILTDIEIVGNDVTLYDLIPETAPDLMAARPVYYFGKYKNAGRNATLSIKGMRGNQSFSKSIAMYEGKSSESLPYLWAREKIRLNEDFNINRTDVKRVKEITALGLKYNLLTKYTSFVAVDNDPVIAADTKTQTVKQPLPMPQGVSNSAIGFEMEIGDIVNDNGTPTLIDVNVNCTDLITKQVIESILAVEMKKMTSEDIQKLIGSELELIIDEGGNIMCKTVITIAQNKLLSLLNTKYQSLGITLKKGVEMLLTIQ